MDNEFNQSASGDPIKQILHDLGIDFSRQPDGTIFVPCDIDLSNRGLTKLPDLSSVVCGGNFYCFGNKLTTLEGMPCEVWQDVSCMNCQLKSLKGASAIVKGNFYCNENDLISLDGAPRYVGGNFFCNDNNLATLKGAPETVMGDFRCNNNKLESLEGGTLNVAVDYYCHNNHLTSLEGAPERIVDFSCYNNALKTIEGAPAIVLGKFDCRWNRLETLEHGPKSFKTILSDFGEYASWDAMPEHIRLSEETRVLRATVLQERVTIQRPLRLKPEGQSG